MREPFTTTEITTKNNKTPGTIDGLRAEQLKHSPVHHSRGEIKESVTNFSRRRFGFRNRFYLVCR